MGHGSARHDLDGEIEILRRLLCDLERIRAGTGPTTDELAGAPNLEQWRRDWRLAQCLSGEVRAHPAIVGDRRLITTSQVFAIDTKGFWARTYSRFYTLGRSAEECNGGACG